MSFFDAVGPTHQLWEFPLVRPTQFVSRTTRENISVPTAVGQILTRGRTPDGVIAQASLDPRLTSHLLAPVWSFQAPDKRLRVAVGFGDCGDDASPGQLRKKVTDGMIRSYLVGVLLALEQDQDGHFALVEDHLTDILGLPRYETTGRKRASRQRLDTIRRELLSLGHIYVSDGPDGRSAAHPEPLLNRIKDLPGDYYYVHARVVWDSIAGYRATGFAQVPRKLLPLHAKDVALGLGLARFIRDEIRMLDGGPGYISTTLEKLASEVGEDVQSKVRDRGAGVYFRLLSEALRRVGREADLAEVRITGTGRLAEAQITPSNSLADAYQPLIASRRTKRAGAKPKPRAARGPRNRG